MNLSVRGVDSVAPLGFWHIEGWPTPAEWGAFWTFTTFVVALVAAIAAFSQLRIILEEREERERPYLAVDFEFRSLLVLISLENISPKLATSVTLTADPLPPFGRVEKQERLDEVFSGQFVIPQVAPGRRISWHLDAAPQLFEDEGAVRRFEITASYLDPLSRKVGWLGFRSSRPAPRRYEDRFVLDLDQYRVAATQEDYDNKNWNIAQRNERQIKSIASSLEAMLRVDRERLRIVDSSHEASAAVPERDDRKAVGRIRSRPRGRRSTRRSRNG